MWSPATVPVPLPPGEAASLLRKAGVAATAPRVAILCALRGAFDHPSPEALYRRLREERPDLSLATVYKALHAFARVGLVHEVSVAGDNRRRFDANLDVHHHLVCTDCHEVRDLYDTDLDGVRTPATPAGFQAQAVSVNVLGRCATCAEVRSTRAPLAPRAPRTSRRGARARRR
jgi:Fe2+ or Zn2+ uptake regulation protein